MSPEGNIVPVDIKELESNGNITVTRFRISGANRFGKPEGEIESKQTFQDAAKALNWSLESPEYAHKFEIPLPNLDLSAYLIGEQRSGDEKLVVSGYGRVGESPRTVDDHHSVSTDYTSFFYLDIKLELSQSTLFDRGVVWLGLGDSPGFIFHTNPGKHTEGELVEGIGKMLLRINRVTSDLLSGE